MTKTHTEVCLATYILNLSELLSRSSESFGSATELTTHPPASLRFGTEPHFLVHVTAFMLHCHIFHATLSE